MNSSQPLTLRLQPYTGCKFYSPIENVRDLEPRFNGFGSARGIDGFCIRLRTAQLSTAVNPAESSPVTSGIIISD
jgi:hypothetical protein